MKLLDFLRRGDTVDVDLHRQINKDLQDLKAEAYHEIRRRELITGMILGRDDRGDPGDRDCERPDDV